MPDPRQTADLLWGTSEPRRRGPKPSLTVQGIVDAALAVADAEGLDAVSMHRVAKELGVTPMSIYRHIPSKDDLVELLVDFATGHPPTLEGATWRERFAEFGRAQKAALRARPWLIDVPMSGPPIGPKSLLWMNAGLETLSGSGLDEGVKLYAILLMTMYVRGDAQLGHNFRQAEQRTGVSESERDEVWLEVLGGLADDDRYSAIGRLLKSGVFDAGGDQVELADADFEFGLQVILNGVATLTTS